MIKLKKIEPGFNFLFFISVYYVFLGKLYGLFDTTRSTNIKNLLFLQAKVKQMPFLVKLLIFFVILKMFSVQVSNKKVKPLDAKVELLDKIGKLLNAKVNLFNIKVKLISM